MADGVTVEESDDCAVLRVRGEVDIALTPDIDAAIEGILGRDIVIDMRDVTFMGSTGLACLLRSKRQAEAQGTELRLRAPSRQVVEVLDMTRLTTVFTIEAG
jgi:anti-sigma B factor antagonist